MEVMEIRGSKFYAGMDMCGYSAEARVRNGDGTVYVHVDDGYGRQYYVTRGSTYDAMIGKAEYAEPEYVVKYDKLADAKRSEYGKVFDTLVKVVNCLSA